MRKSTADPPKGESPEVADAKDPFGYLVFETGINSTAHGDAGEATFPAPRVPSLRSSIRRPSQYNLSAVASRKSSVVNPYTAGNNSFRSSVPADFTQSHPTALPNEFLALIRTFRHNIESATGSATTAAQQDELRDLQHVCSDIVRFVTSFLIQKYEEQNEYERKKLLGWSGSPPAQAAGAPLDPKSQPGELNLAEGRKSNSAKPAAPSSRTASLAAASGPEVLGPFLLSALYVVAESLLHLLKCDRCMIFLPDGTKLKSVVSVGSATVAAPLFYDFSNGACGVVYSSGVAVNIADAERAPPQLFSRHTDELSKRGYHVRNLLCFPLVLPQDEPMAVGPPKIKGVVTVFNKVKNTVFPTGFTPEDEESLHHYTLLIATILRWGNNKVEFCSNTSQEESSRLQQLILQNRFVDALATRRTTGGTNTQTRLEANQKMRRQLQVEAAKERQDEEGLIVQHPAMRMAFRASGIQRTRIYRTPTALPDEEQKNSSTKTDGQPLSFILSEASQVVTLGGNVRELLLMLEQADTSWKASRQECVAMRDRIAALEASLQIERKRRFEVEQLCRSCGITLPTPKPEDERIRLAVKLDSSDGADITPNAEPAGNAKVERSRPNSTLLSAGGDSRREEAAVGFEEIAQRIELAQKQQFTYDSKVLGELAKLEQGIQGLLVDKPDFDSSTWNTPQRNAERGVSANSRTTPRGNTGLGSPVSTKAVKALINTLASHQAPAPAAKSSRR